MTSGSRSNIKDDSNSFVSRSIATISSNVHIIACKLVTLLDLGLNLPQDLKMSRNEYFLCLTALGDAEVVGTVAEEYIGQQVNVVQKEIAVGYSESYRQRHVFIF